MARARDASTAEGTHETIVGAAIVDPASMLQKVQLVSAVNRTISDRFGEQPTPVLPGGGPTTIALQSWADAGVEFSFALEAVLDLASSQDFDADNLPGSLRYFERAVLRRWQAELAHRAAATFERPAAPAAPATSEPTGLLLRQAITAARDGEVAWIQYCEEHGIDYQAAA